jgi:hypothetical protein
VLETGDESSSLCLGLLRLVGFAAWEGADKEEKQQRGLWPGRGLRSPHAESHVERRAAVSRVRKGERSGPLTRCPSLHIRFEGHLSTALRFQGFGREATTATTLTAAAIRLLRVVVAVVAVCG